MKEINGLHLTWDERYHTLNIMLDNGNLHNPYHEYEYHETLFGKDEMIELRDFLDQKIKECS